MITGKIIIAGNGISAGVDLDDAEEIGPISRALVVVFDTKEEYRQAMKDRKINIKWADHPDYDGQ